MINCKACFPKFSFVSVFIGTPGEITDSTSTIPWPWTVGELSTDIGSFLFTYAITRMENGDKFPVVEKSVQLCINKELRYFVYGSAVNVHRCKLPQILEDIALLPQALKKFQNINLCNGLGTINVHHLSANSAFKDYVDRWHSKNCTLISKRKRCDHCMNMRNLVQMKEARSKTKVSLKRVCRVSNPIDQKKLIALRKKCFRERQQKKTAQKRIQLLQELLQNKETEIASIRGETLADRCSKLNVPTGQQTVLREIIAAAGKKNDKSRRYGEEWIMLCLLMNIRSPGYFEFLRKNNVLPLPCHRTIRSYPGE